MKCDPIPRRRPPHCLRCATILHAGGNGGVIMNNRSTWSVALAGLLTLAGCGGGGDAPSPAPLAAITTTNALTIASSVVTASLEGGNLGSFVGFASASSPKPERVYYAKVSEIQNAEIGALVRQTRIGAVIPVGSEVTQCTGGGTITLSGDIANPATLSPNDTITFEYAACVEGDTTMNGRFSMRVTGFSGDPASGVFSFAVATTITSLQVTVAGETATLNGSVSISISAAATTTVTTTVSSSSITVGDGGADHTLRDYSSVHTLASGSFTLDVSGSLTSSDFAGMVSFDTTAVLQGMDDGYAFTGQLLITGANGATIEVIVLDGTFVRLEVDSNGDGIVDATLDVTWDDLT